MWTRLVLCAFVLGLLPAADFSGTWALVLEKSDFGRANPPKSMTMTVRQSPSQLAVSSTLVDARGESQSQYTLDLTGKETENTVRGNRSVSVTSWRGPALHIKAKTTVQGMEIKTVDEWQLDSGGRILTIFRTAVTPNGEIEQRYVYEKSLAKP
ncbi:MAG TPA: hypothetical protein VFQ91_27920 [Bryobacteraceae bacterium]|nr:hypothetical protein [Bryobacteraceae bacterium]